MTKTDLITIKDNDDIPVNAFLVKQKTKNKIRQSNSAENAYSAMSLENVKKGDATVLNAGTGNCTSIVIASESGSYNITLVPATGYHYVSR